MRANLLRATLLALLITTVFVFDVEAQRSYRPGDNGTFRLRVGQFEPEADSQYWNEKFADFTGQPSSFEDLFIGFDYMLWTNRTSGVLFGFGFYDGDTTQAYRDYETGDGGQIRHLTSLEIGEVTAAYVVHFGRRGTSPTPYVGAGVGLIWYDLEEIGAFIDFGTEGLPIFDAAYTSSTTEPMYFALAGVEVPIGPSLSIGVEGRWKEADSELEDDFAGLGEIDLSGLELSAVVSWSF